MIKFFHSYEITSKITEIDQNIIKRVYIILNTLNSGYIIDAEKYKCYAIETAKIYKELYPLYYMPFSVHKMLLHGHAIIKELPISIGHASEDGMEASYKIIKAARKKHTCKINREKINEDLVH